MAEGEDWMMRPVLRGMCKYESLKDCTIDLYDLAVMNDAIDVELINQAAIREAAKKDGS